MPIEAMYWDTGVRAMEIHVLAGSTSPDLRISHLLFQIHDNHDSKLIPAAEYFITNSDVTLKFTIADASKKPGDSTRDFSALGIRLNTASGEVTVGPNPNPPGSPLPPLPALFPQNFLLEVTATNSGAAEPLKEMIRIHIHKSITKIWLTPDTMKLRASSAGGFPETTPVRFGLRARFDDDTVGDITDWIGIEWKTRRGATTTNNIEPSDGTLIILAGDVAAAPITVSAKLTLFPALGTVTATLRVIEPWKPQAPIDARLVPGGGWPTPFALEAVPNVLFIPDGFPPGSDSENAFYTYVNSLVAFMKTDSLCKPYDVLADSINFWAAFIPSDQQGITWGSEVFDAGGFVFAVPKPKRPLDVPVEPIWDLDRLIYEVGLPKPSDRPAAPRTNTQITDNWHTLFGDGLKAHMPPATDPDPKKPTLTKLVDSWRSLGTRRILDDVDTPLGVMSGAPRVDVSHDLFDLNPDRMTREHLNDLLAALRDKDVATSGLQLNNIWTDKTKRNYDLVCIVTLGQGREQNSDGYFMLAQQTVLQPCTITGVNDIVPGPLFLKGTADSPEPRVFVHELSHSFDLGDEYGGFNDRPLFPAEVQHDHRTECNLQSPSSLMVGGDITGEEIKWRWPRIRWAAEIIGALQDEGGGMFSAPIRLSHAFGFPIGEIVHLRFRDINFAWRNVPYDDQSSYLVKLPLVSVPLKLVETFDTGTPTVRHIRLHVESGVAFPYPSASTVQPADFVAKFPPGSIAYQPTKAPAGVFNATTYPYAELLAKNVMEQVTFLHAAVGRTNIDLSLPEKPAFPTMTIRKGFLDASRPFIVALYEGGSGNAKGIFHPTGDCMMNDQDSGARFCHVCRYVLVDAIDPSRHLFIDPETIDIYPQE